MPGPLSSFDLLQRLAVFGERRQQVLSENVANIDTPNYKTRDLDLDGFRAAMREAVAAATAPPSSGSPSAASAAADPFAAELFAARPIDAPNVTFQDGNNRSIEREVTELTKNLLMQNFAVELMSAQTQLLASVISERP